MYIFFLKLRNSKIPKLRNFWIFNDKPFDRSGQKHYIENK